MPTEFIPRIPKYCASYQLRKTLQQNAVRKDGSRHNFNDSNLLFPPSMIQTHLNFESVKAVVDCSCDVCRPVIVREPVNDKLLVDEIRAEPGKCLLLAVLVYMGAGFAMRHLYSHGLGRENNLHVEEAFANNADLKVKLFGHLTNPSDSRPTLNIDERAAKFCEMFAETKQLFSPPHFREGEILQEFPPNANLPFVGETELRDLESSFARLYSFRIHQDFCSPELSVRSHFKSYRPH